MPWSSVPAELTDNWGQQQCCATMECMKQFAASGNLVRTPNCAYKWGARLGAVGMSLALMACGGSPQTAESASASAAAPTPTVPAPSRAPQPSTDPSLGNWPPPVALSPVDCTYGKAIVRQRPHMWNGKLAAYVNGLCNYGPNSSPSDPVGAYYAPHQLPPGQAPIKAQNGETVLIDCVNPSGQDVGDNTGFVSKEWIHGTFNDESTGGRPVEAYVPIANLAQLVTDGIKPC